MSSAGVIARKRAGWDAAMQRGNARSAPGTRQLSARSQATRERAQNGARARRGGKVSPFAVVTGDYVTPHTGQRGRWSHVVSPLGLQPRSPSVKGLHMALGLWWLASLASFFFHSASGTWALLLCSVFTLR